MYCDLIQPNFYYRGLTLYVTKKCLYWDWISCKTEDGPIWPRRTWKDNGEYRSTGYESLMQIIEPPLWNSREPFHPLIFFLQTTSLFLSSSSTKKIKPCAPYKHLLSSSYPRTLRAPEWLFWRLASVPHTSVPSSANRFPGVVLVVFRVLGSCHPCLFVCPPLYWVMSHDCFMIALSILVYCFIVCSY